MKLRKSHYRLKFGGMMQFTKKRITVWNGHTQLMFAFSEISHTRVLSFSERLVDRASVRYVSMLIQSCVNTNDIMRTVNCSQAPHESTLCQVVVYAYWVLMPYWGILDGTGTGCTRASQHGIWDRWLRAMRRGSMISVELDSNPFSVNGILVAYVSRDVGTAPAGPRLNIY